jgi:hypothetical protein
MSSDARTGSGSTGSSSTRPGAGSAQTGPVPGAFGSRRAAQRGEPGSSSASGTVRAGRRAHPVRSERSFLDRNRSRLIGAGIIAGIVLISAFVFVSASQPAYACSIQLDPASPAPSGTTVTGQREDDLGRQHVTVGTQVTYTYCPPASGNHYNAAGQGPIAPRFYGPDDTTIPQNWIHNLEHGGLVVVYNCARSGCDTASLDQLRQLATNFPASPICKIPPLIISPVIARFDTMKSNFAALVWDRVLFQDKLDTAQILEFFKNVAESANPEKQCNPNASGSPSLSTNPANPEPTNPVAQPAPSDSGASGSPAGSAASPAAPTGSVEPSPSVAPAATAAPSSS